MVCHVNSITELCFLIIKDTTAQKNEVPYKVFHKTHVLLAGIRLYRLPFAAI